MAIFREHKVRCACGTPFTAHLARSVNISRTPQVRAAIIKGTFHSFQCPGCKQRMTVERPFSYTDPARGCLFYVKPRSRRHEFRQSSSLLDRAAKSFPADSAPEAGHTLRAVFGLDELREKLVAQDAGYDDKDVELFKVLLVYEHPVLLRRPRLRLSLQGVDQESLTFSAAYEHAPERFGVSLPRKVAENVTKSRSKAWADEAHGDASVYKEPDHYVNMWRWSPQPSALDRLRTYAAQVRAGSPIDTNSTDFAKMLSGIPRGTHLPAWAKQDLRVLEDYAQKKGMPQLEDKLFEIRFDLSLADDWAANNKPKDIATLWQLLDALPDSNVEGNTKIHEIVLGSGGGGVYDPGTMDIEIGEDELGREQSFQDVVRHEVGHAVHEMLDAKVNAWLTSVGWKTFESTDKGIDGWVALMGGWGKLTTAQKKKVRGYLRSALGKGSSWTPGKLPAIPKTDPWKKQGFGPRLAFEKTQADWFEHFKTWHRAGGKAFFLNYWYQTLIAVDVSVLKLIEEMPSTYAAMSHFEFFAELYALYFDEDNPRGRAKIPAAMAKWLADNIAADKLPRPMMARPAAKLDYETIERPRPKTANEPRKQL